MAKPSSSSPPESAQSAVSPAAEISDDISPEIRRIIRQGFESVGISADLPDHCRAKDFFSVVVVADVLKPLSVQPGRLSYLLTVKHSVTNYYSTVSGGAIASIAEAASIACARTAVGEENKELFLGELSISYLSAARENAEVIVDASVVRKGRNVTVVAVDFRLKETQNLIYRSRATFYNTPLPKL